MKRNAILLIVLVSLGALIWWLSTERGEGTLAGPLTDFNVQDTARVTRIFIAEHNGRSADLRRAEDGGWTVDGSFRAKKHHLDLLLKTLLRVEVKSPVPKSAEANVLKAMAGTARKVEIYENGSKTPSKIWYVGHPTQEHTGTYMLLELPGKGRSSVPYIMGMSGFAGHLTSRFHADLDEWRSSEVFMYPDLDAITQVTVEHPMEPASTFTVKYAGGNNLALLDGAGAPVAMDSLAVKDFLLQFKRINYEYIDRQSPKAVRDSVTASPAQSIISITDKSGRTITNRFWYMHPQAFGVDEQGADLKYDVNRMHALVGDTVLVAVQRHLFDRITIGLNDLRAR